KGLLYIFFFQAEDGIRDRNVTGVQTCALPIFDVRNGLSLTKTLNVTNIDTTAPTVDSIDLQQKISGGFARRIDGAFGLFFNAQRSEERRVGKECRSRWKAGQ